MRTGTLIKAEPLRAPFPLFGLVWVRWWRAMACWARTVKGMNLRNLERIYGFDSHAIEVDGEYRLTSE